MRASREKKKSRLMGGIITGVRIELKEKGNAKSSQNLMERKIEINNQM